MPSPRGRPRGLTRRLHYEYMLVDEACLSEEDRNDLCGRFMSIVREQAEKQDATNADDELIEAEATMEALRKKLSGNDDKSRPL